MTTPSTTEKQIPFVGYVNDLTGGTHKVVVMGTTFKGEYFGVSHGNYIIVKKEELKQ